MTTEAQAADLERAIAACHQCIADACTEHDLPHLRRAVARLKELLALAGSAPHCPTALRH